MPADNDDTKLDSLHFISAGICSRLVYRFYFLDRYICHIINSSFLNENYCRKLFDSLFTR